MKSCFRAQKPMAAEKSCKVPVSLCRLKFCAGVYVCLSWKLWGETYGDRQKRIRKLCKAGDAGPQHLEKSLARIPGRRTDLHAGADSDFCLYVFRYRKRERCIMDNLKSHRTQRDPHGNPYIPENRKIRAVPERSFRSPVLQIRWFRRQSNIRRRAMSSGTAARSLRSPDRWSSMGSLRAGYSEWWNFSGDSRKIRILYSRTVSSYAFVFYNILAKKSLT